MKNRGKIDYQDKITASGDDSATKMDKAEFLQTEFGEGLKECIECWDRYLTEGDQVTADLST